MRYEKDVLKAMSQEEAQKNRDVFVRDHLIPIAKEDMEENAFTFYVAQYWDDNADDEMHCLMIRHSVDQDATDADIMLSATRAIAVDTGSRWRSDARMISQYDVDLPWNHSSDAVTLWAAWAHDHGDQCAEEYNDNYSPAVTIVDGERVIWHPMQRPYLDGVMSQYQVRDMWSIEEDA